MLYYLFQSLESFPSISDSSCLAPRDLSSFHRSIVSANPRCYWMQDSCLMSLQPTTLWLFQRLSHSQLEVTLKPCIAFIHSWYRSDSYNRPLGQLLTHIVDILFHVKSLRSRSIWSYLPDYVWADIYDLYAVQWISISIRISLLAVPSRNAVCMHSYCWNHFMHAIVFEKLFTIAHQRSVVYDPFAMSYSPSLQVYLKLALQGLPYALLFISTPRGFPINIR